MTSILGWIALDGLHWIAAAAVPSLFELSKTSQPSKHLEMVKECQKNSNFLL